MHKTALLFACLIATGCTSKTNWSHSRIDSGSTQFSSARLSHTLSDAPNRLQLEIIQTKDSCKGFLYVHTKPIPPSKENPKEARVTLQIGEETLSYLALRHAGGHKLLLPEEALAKILEALQKDEEVTLKSAGYTATLSPNGFQKEYKKFRSPSFLSKLGWRPL